MRPAAVAEPEIKPGDLVCANCHTGNDPARRFCRRCGTSLERAAVARPLPWYRRLFRRRQRVLAAGERPGSLGEAGQPRGSMLGTLARAALPVIVGLAVAGYALVPTVSTRVNSAVEDIRRMLIPELEPVRPTAGGAGRPDHEADKAFDAVTNSYWLANPESGPPTATLAFEGEVDLGAVLLQIGTDEDGFLAQQRPRVVELRAAGGATTRIELQDKPDLQRFDIDLRDVTQLTLVVVDSYSNADGRFVAIREVEFFARK